MPDHCPEFAHLDELPADMETALLAVTYRPHAYLDQAGIGAPASSPYLEVMQTALRQFILDLTNAMRDGTHQYVHTALRLGAQEGIISLHQDALTAAALGADYDDVLLRLVKAHIVAITEHQEKTEQAAQEGTGDTETGESPPGT